MLYLLVWFLGDLPVGYMFGLICAAMCGDWPYSRYCAPLKNGD